MADKQYIDIHSHILPGMDDGARNIEQSLEMLRIAEEQGICIMYATPHYMPGKGKPSIERIERKIRELQDAADQAGIRVSIRPGVEYYYMEEILELFEQGKVITLGDSNCVLIEFDPSADRLYIRNALEEVISFGYTPILAHVERYISMMEKGFTYVEEYRNMGVMMQVNSASVSGDVGKKTQKNVKAMLKKHLIDFVATDAHSARSRAPYMEKTAKLLEKKYGKKYRDQLLHENATKYL